MVLLPAAKLGESSIEAFQYPPVVTKPPATVKPIDSPLMSNNMFAGNRVPSTCSSPLPLSDVILPEILNSSPATGLSSMSSITSMVRERMLIVEKLALTPRRSELPAKMTSTVVIPSGWLNGIL